MLINDNKYLSVIYDIKQRIGMAQQKAMLAVNNELVGLYWHIGLIVNTHSEWGNKFVDNLAQDIKLAFPHAKGYSPRNLKYMAKFAKLFPSFEIMQAPLAQISWYHNIALMDKIKNEEQYIWYASQCVQNGWSRNILVHQIELNLYQRQVLAEKSTNFHSKLPQTQSELATQILKDPYIFDFIQQKEQMLEQDLEKSLVQNITQFLLELGTGFAYIGRQYHLEVAHDDFYIDLLFYNLNLRCYVVVELKTGDFKPEYVGKLNFYLTAVDEQLKKEHDNPSIGLLLCKHKNKLVVEYSLRDLQKPIGVSEYQLTHALPQELINTLPSAKDIEERFIDTIIQREQDKNDETSI